MLLLATSSFLPVALSYACGVYKVAAKTWFKCRLASIEKPCRWNEFVTLSAKYRDLTMDAQLAFTVSRYVFFLLINTQSGVYKQLIHEFSSSL